MHMTADHLELYLLGRLTEDQASLVVLHLVECRSCENLLEETRVFVQRLRQLSQRLDRGREGLERRKHQRVPTDDLAKLRVLQPVVLEIEDVQILDTSLGGLRLRVGRLLEPSTLVQVRMKSLVILAKVRYCRQVGDTYQAGVEIQDTLPGGGA
jgi:hypothetical protein